MRKLKDIVIHPFLITAFPILSLLAHNIDQINPISAWRPLLISLVGTAILLLLLKLVFRDWHQAGILCSLFVILFFTYGHLYQFIRNAIPFGPSIGRHRVLIPVWLIIALLGVWLITRRLKKPQSVTPALNATLALVLIIPIFQLVNFGFRSLQAWKEHQPIAELQDLELPDEQNSPDIYYIILDGYARSDILEEYFGFDNSLFLNWLSERGFQIAEKSQSNYAQTRLSLASSLNMDYLQSLRSDLVAGDDDRSVLFPLVQRSVFRQTIEQLGYTVVAFESGYSVTQFEDADFYITRRTSKITEFYALGQMNGFEAMLLQNSALLVLTDAVIVLPDIFLLDNQAPFHDHRERILFVLDKLTNTPSMEGPKFVFAHLVIPHPPFIFAVNEEEVVLPKTFTLAETEELEDDASYIEGYLNQLQFTNIQMESVIDEILASSDIPPIIIIQADHGPGRFSAVGRMAILNAYYLPGVDDSLIYDSISPVNSFRIVLNEYFGASYPLLEDIAYYSIYQDPYNFHVVVDENE